MFPRDDLPLAGNIPGDSFRSPSKCNVSLPEETVKSENNSHSCFDPADTPGAAI
jgi:hypothetical protein